MIKLKSATVWAVILWVLIFVEISVVMFIPALQGSELTQKVIHLLVLPLMVLFCSHMYFKGTRPDLKQGFVLGVYFLVVGTILDLAITVSLFTGFSEFYSQWSLWLGFLEVLVFSSFYGYFLGRR